MSIKEIKESLEKGNIVVGLKQNLQRIKQNKISKIFVCNNCPENAKADLERYSKMGGVKLELLNKSNEDLGVLCKKPYSILVLGILKE